MPMLMIPPTTPTGVLRFEWVDRNGVVRDFSRNTSPNLFVAIGSSGLGHAEFDPQGDKLPFGPGELTRHINTQSRQLEIPIFIRDDSLGDLVGAVEGLYGWFFTGDETGKQPGYWRITRPDDSVRQIASYFKGGLEGNTQDGGVNWVKYVASFVCPDPWPTDSVNTDSSRTVAEAAMFSIINQGDQLTYPSWTFNGPFTSIVVTNVTTGKAFTVTLTLTAGQYLLINTLPASVRRGPAVLDNNGIIRLVNVTGTLWTLPTGQSNITITFTGSDSNTSVLLSYLARYWSLLR